MYDDYVTLALFLAHIVSTMVHSSDAVRTQETNILDIPTWIYHGTQLPPVIKKTLWVTFSNRFTKMTQEMLTCDQSDRGAKSALSNYYFLFF